MRVSRIRRTLQRNQIYQIENLTQINGKGFGALADEHLGRHCATGQFQLCNMFARIGFVRRDGFQADIVDRFDECGLGRITHLCQLERSSGAPIAADHLHAKGFPLVDIGVIHPGNLPCLAQRNAHALAAHHQLDPVAAVNQLGVEIELKRKVFNGITIAVDVDFVHRIIVQRKVVRAAIWGLYRDIVRNHGHIFGTSRLIAAEHVKVCAIHTRHTGQCRCFAVAGSPSCGSGQSNCPQQHGGDQQRIS